MLQLTPKKISSLLNVMQEKTKKINWRYAWDQIQQKNCRRKVK